MKHSIASLCLFYGVVTGLISHVSGINMDGVNPREEEMRREIESDHGLRWTKSDHTLHGGGILNHKKRWTKSGHTLDGGIRNHKKNVQKTDLSETNNRAVDLNLPEDTLLDMTYSFNLLTGLTPEQQRQQSVGDQLFEFSETNGERCGLPFYAELSELRCQAVCENTSQESTSSWSSSSSTLEEQSSSSSIDLGVPAFAVPLLSSIPGFGSVVSSSLAFGNSRESSESFDRSESGMTYSLERIRQRRVLTVNVNHDNINSWTTRFRESCDSLGDSPDSNQVIDFFHSYGTHSLDVAQFGKKCSSTTYMESGQTESAYRRAETRMRNIGFSFFSIDVTGQRMRSRSEDLSRSEGFSIETDVVQCEGDLTLASACNIDPGFVDLPAIIDWRMRPIWKLNVTELTSGAKENLLLGFKNFTKASAQCAETNCNSNGVCAPDHNMWKSKTPTPNRYDFSAYFDGDRCFCFENYQGKDCGETRGIELSAPNRVVQYVNAYDRFFSFGNGGKPICGTSSVHNNYREDRRFKFFTCDFGREESITPGRTTWTRRTGYRENFTVQCPKNTVLTGVRSDHRSRSGRVEDRYFEFGCTQFNGAITTTCDNYPAAWANAYDEALDFSCGFGKTIVGVRSEFARRNKDRRFKFKCCEMKVDPIVATALLPIIIHDE